MKNNDIQQLLERYREGTLSDSELADLNRLTGRDEVLAAAEHRATGIIRRRRSVVFTVAGLMVVGLALWTLLPRQEGPMVAEATVPVVTPTEPVMEQTAPADTLIPVKAVPHKAVARPATVAQTIETAAEEPVVVCNNQCEADSVISDIWKFLTV